MARGHDKHKQRQADVAGLGRQLNRRARSHCELCGERASLTVVELPPPPEQPHPDQAVMVCGRCQPLVQGDKPRDDPDTLRFLAEAVWSETAPAQIAAVRATRTLAAAGVGWARDTLDSLFLDEAIEERI